MPDYTAKLCLGERKLIAYWKNQGLSNKECARRLHRHPSTIGREIKRNWFKKDVQGRFIYEPLYAQGMADKRQQRVWHSKHPLKNKDIYAYVMDNLRGGWSPEQIAGRLKLEHPNDKHWHICHETIYNFIYHPKNKHLQLWQYLRRKQRQRKKNKQRKTHRLRIPDRVSIHQRPKLIDRRKKLGHWEGDSIVGKGKLNGLHTAYERVSSLVRLEKMDRINSVESIIAQFKIYAYLPKKARQSTTLDNGSEHVLHFKLKKLDMKTYFADPYASYQRGGNENANLWVRYYFPKGTDFSTISKEEIKDVEWELNNRPRKRLGYKKPIEVFREKLKGLR